MSNADYKRPFTVGMFIFIGIAILIAAVFTVGSKEKIFTKKFVLKIVFDDVSGLQPGNNVWLSGVKVGTVKKIMFSGASQVEVTVGIEKQAQGRIWRNSKARISTDGFIGNKIVVIYAGNSESGPVDDGTILQSEKSISTDEMMETLQVNNKNLLAITGDFQKIAKKIAMGEGTIGGLINDNSILENLGSIMENLRAVTLKSQVSLSNISNFTSRLDKQQGLVNEMISDTLIYKDLLETVSQLKRAIISASAVIDSVQIQSNKLKREDNTIGVLLNDPEMARELKEMIRNLKVSSVKLDEDLEAVQHNFLFRGYFRKKEKAQIY